jgi:hypothetical protein
MEKEMARLTEKEMAEKVRSATRGLKGEELVNKALELYDIYGESAMYYMDVDAYLDEGDTYVSVSPCETWENDNVGFAITHGFTETDPEGIEDDFAGTYTPEDELFFFPRLPKPVQEEVDARESQLVMDTENVRAYILDGTPVPVDVKRSFYSPSDDERKGATVTLDMQKQNITILINGEKHANRYELEKSIAESLWGYDTRKGTKDIGFVYSPKGKLMGPKDFVDAVMKVEEAIEPAHTMSRITDLNGMRAELQKAVSADIKERGLTFEEPVKGQTSINR